MSERELKYQSSRGTIVYDAEREEYTLQHERHTILGMHDWGKDFHQTLQDREFVIVQFKNQRVDYFINSNLLPLHRGDLVTVSAAPGHDVGIVVVSGWLARREYLKGSCHMDNSPADAQELKMVYRRASVNDVERWMNYVSQEQQALVHARSLTKECELDIKISDVEYQGDGSRLTVYYSSLSRVDFRAYVRRLSDELSCRVTMRQFNNRQEASVVGGIGACGRPICCTTWLRKLESVVTADIKMQELALHYQRYAGQCEKLKCCLKFELDTYAEAKKRFPRLKGPLLLNDGVQLFHVKNDLFRDLLWFSPEKKSTRDLVMLTLPQVQQILERNERGESGGAIQEYTQQSNGSAQRDRQEQSYSVGDLNEESITRFDRAAKGGKKGNRKRKGGGSPDASSPRRQGKKTGAPRDRVNAKSAGKEQGDSVEKGRRSPKGQVNRPEGAPARRQPSRRRKPGASRGKGEANVGGDNQ